MQDGNQSVICYLIQLMVDMYHTELQQFKAVIDNEEGVILVMTVLRIMTQIVVRAPLDQMPSEH